jgi:hypothetical protein
MANTFRPDFPVRSNQVLTLQRGNGFQYTYKLRGGKPFPFGTDAYLTFRNTYGQIIDAWQADTATGALKWAVENSRSDAIPDGSSWTLMIDLNDGENPHLFEQGSVVRDEPRFPSAPGVDMTFNGVRYGYSFGTPGFVSDPSWRVLNGNPRVYSNTSVGLPNAVAAGSLAGGDLTFFDDVAMLYYAPLNGDSVRLTYNVVQGAGIAGGMAYVVLCSNYDMSNSVALYHRQFFGSGNAVGIATGNGPVSYTVRAQIPHTTFSLENYTAEFNASSNTYSLYLGTATTPIVSWQDTGHLIDHGPGERYLGFAFQSALLFPGCEVSDWVATDII